MMQRIVESVRFQAKKTGALVEVEELPDCMGDEVQTNQVFSNLVDNALKYLDPERKGLIRIKGWMQEGRSIYCVEDNGLGIPKNHQGKIFEVFHRVNPKGSVSGEGIGLTTVKQILDRQVGRIWLESEAGKSSRFFVSLPGKK